MDGFDAAMEQQRETARAAGKFGGATTMPAELVGAAGADRIPGLRRNWRPMAWKSLALLKDGRAGRADRGRRRSRGDPRPHAVLRRKRRPGRRHRRAREQARARFAVRDTQKFAGQFHGHVGALASRRRSSAATVSARRSTPRAAPRPCSTIPPPTCCTPRCASVLGDARHAEGLAGRARSPALRLLALPAAHRQRTGRDRAPRQRRDPPQSRGRSAPHGHAGSARLRRDGAVRREVRRARARAADGRLLDRAVRRHARRPHRRHRPVQDRRPKAASPPACAASRR